MKVLICDDDFRTRQALKAFLDAQEDSDNNTFNVVGQAQNGLEAILCVDNLQPEVVVIDACMPGMNGLEATRIIKKQWPNVRVVMLTMYPDQHSAALQAGVDAFLAKGCMTEVLLKAILG